MLAQTFADSKIIARVEGGIGTLVFDHARRKNALNQAMWLAVPTALGWMVEQAARVVVVTGEGADFSAGADISEFAEMRRDTNSALGYESANSAAFAAIRQCPVPVIAAISGICFGGGFGLAAAADIRIADHDARFCVPPARLGLAYPADAVADIVQALGSQWARIALYTGRQFSAAEMLSIGFIAEQTATLAARGTALAMAAVIADNAPLSVRAGKLAVRAAQFGTGELLQQAIAAGAATFDSADYAEGRAAFSEKRRPSFQGC